MKALEEKIAREGVVLPGNILKVGSFLNHQLDVDFLMEMGREIAALYAEAGVTKLLTIESSGIAIAVAAAAAMHLPVVFAKKNRTSNLDADCYRVSVHSFTHQREYDVVVSREYLNAGDRLLIVDDFLACGNALIGLTELARQAGASVAGAAIAIEKGFQHGGDKLREQGLRVESLAIIENMEDGKVLFRS